MSVHWGIERAESQRRNARHYIEAYTVVEGALDDEREFFDRDNAQAEYWYGRWVERVKDAAREDGAQTDLYRIDHDHPIDMGDDVEDTCVQYLTDHRPEWSSDVE